jgi:hypothetical protein
LISRFSAQTQIFLCPIGVRRPTPVQAATRLRYPVAVISALVQWRQAGLLAGLLAGMLAVAWPSPSDAQNRQRKPAPRQNPSTAAPASPTGPAPGTTRETPLMQCPSVLGNGTKSQRLFCDVLIGSYPAGGLRITIPPHEGKATLFFTIHNRQTVPAGVGPAGVAPAGAAPAVAASAAAATGDAAKKDTPAAAPAYARYTATLRVLAPNGSEVQKAVVQSEYRSLADLVERIAGGAGPGGVKAVAPTGSEPIVVDIPPGLTEVSLVGEKLVIERLDGSESVTTAGRPIAVVSQVFVEYQPVVSGTSAGKRRS